MQRLGRSLGGVKEFIHEGCFLVSLVWLSKAVRGLDLAGADHTDNSDDDKKESDEQGLNHVGREASGVGRELSVEGEA